MSIQFPKDFKGVQENPAIIQLTTGTENTEQPIQMVQSEALSSTNVDEFSSESGQTQEGVEAEEGVDIGKLFQDFLKSLDVNGDGKISTDEANGAAKTEENTETERVSEPGSVEEKVDNFDKALEEVDGDINNIQKNSITVNMLKDLKGDDLKAFIEAYDAKHGENAFIEDVLMPMQWGADRSDEETFKNQAQFRQNILDLGDEYVEQIYDTIDKIDNEEAMENGRPPVFGFVGHSNNSLWLREGMYWLNGT